jgi:hypothetical protein
MSRSLAKFPLIIASRLVAVAILFPRYTHARLSCHKCRALQSSARRSILGITLSVSVSPDETTTTPAQAACTHEWWQYSFYYQDGLCGLVSKDVRCNPTQYKDGWRPKG